MVRAGIDETHVRGMYEVLGLHLVELLRLSFSKRFAATIGPRVILSQKDEALLRTSLETGGIVIAMSHTGNWDLVACALAKRFPLSVVTKRLSVKWIDRIWQGMRASFSVDLIDAKAGAFGIARQAVANGRLVAMMIDQAPPTKRNSIRAHWLGAEAWHDRSAALLARSTVRPLVTVAVRRDPLGRQEVHFLGISDPRNNSATLSVGDWIDRATLASADLLASFVRENPTQWLWLHRRWKDVP